MSNRVCETCGHTTPAEHTFCESCGADGTPAKQGVRFGRVLAGAAVGAFCFPFVGFFFNIAVDQTPHWQFLANLLLTAALLVAALAQIKFRRGGRGFVMGMLFVLFGGFLICTAMLGSASAT